jgi:hypothetical protein
MWRRPAESDAELIPAPCRADGHWPGDRRGRHRAILDRLPAAAAVALGGPDDAEALAAAAGPDGIHVIIDYLWAPPTEAAIAAVTRRGLAHAAPPCPRLTRLFLVSRASGPPSPPAGNSSHCPSLAGADLAGRVRAGLALRWRLVGNHR